MKVKKSDKVNGCITKPTRYFIILKSGQVYQTKNKFDNDEAVKKWLNTRMAQLLFRVKTIKIFPEDVDRVEPISEEKMSKKPVSNNQVNVRRNKSI